MFTYILIIIIVIPCSFLAYDIFVRINCIYKLIHIGKWDNPQEWESAVYNVCCNWARKTPIVKINRDGEFAFCNIFARRNQHPAIQYWQEAGLLLGLSKSGSHYSSYIIKRNINSTTGDWKYNFQHADIGLLAYAILRDSHYPNEIHLAMDKVYLFFTSNLDNGTIPYRTNLPNIRFVDTLGMACPFLMLYGTKYHNENAIELAMKQIEEYDQAFHPNCHIPCHAYDIKLSKPMGIYDWGRGIGWYILAIVECLNICEQNNNYKILLSKKAISLANVLLPLQLENGGYAEMIFNRKGFAESSGSILIGILMTKCYQLTQHEIYRESASRIINRLMSSTLRSGQIYYCQGDTRGIGYYSKTFSTLPFAQGMLLYLISEFKLLNAHNS